MNVFEDAGYFCVDNLPAEMIRSLADLFTHPGSSVERAAVVSDLRGGTYFERLAEVLDELDAAGIAHRVLFLAADEEALSRATRRRAGATRSRTGHVAGRRAARGGAARPGPRARRHADRHHRA